MENITTTQFFEWSSKLKNKSIPRIWHSLGSHIWIDLGEVFSEELGANGFYKMYEYTIHTSRKVNVIRNGKVVLSKIDDSNKLEVDQILTDLSTLKLKFVDLQIFEKTIKIKLSDDFEIQVLEADSENFEFDISLREENKAITVTASNTIQLAEYDEPIMN